jgi:glycosyltransferase involved in cell wall biosynthesis
MNQNCLKDNLPKVSVCTPTFNRRPFIPFLIKCFNNQSYPKDRLEWIIIDDGTDKVEDLFLPLMKVNKSEEQKYIVKYFKCDEKMTLGKKRNLAHEKCSGDIILYMDDDDYYPPERIIHAVQTLQENPNALCAGSSIMFIYFKHLNKMYKFGPYGPNHSTAATFAFRKELLQETNYDDEACIAEEKKFLKNYTIPFVQLDPMKTILVFSHNHNSFDKKLLLKDGINKYVNKSKLTPENFIKEKDILDFFMNDIDESLDSYEPGKPEFKPDVLKQMDEIKQKRENVLNENKQRQQSYYKNTSTANLNKMDDMTMLINELLMENKQLKEKVNYLEDKIKKIVTQKIDEIKKKNS